MLYRYSLFWIGVALLLLLASAAAGDEYADARQNLVDIIEQDVRDTSLYLDKEALDPRVMAAMGKVSREAFVPRI